MPTEIKEIKGAKQLEEYLRASPIKIPKDVVLLTDILVLQYKEIEPKLMNSSDQPDWKAEDPGFFNLRHLRSLKDTFRTGRKNELMNLYYFLVGFSGFESFNCGQLEESEERELVVDNIEISFLARLIGQEIKMFAKDPVFKKKTLEQAQLILSGAAHAKVLHETFSSGSSDPLTFGYMMGATVGSKSYSGLGPRIQLNYDYYRNSLVSVMQGVRDVLAKYKS